MTGLPYSDDALLVKHHGRVALVYANLLLLYLVGKCDPRIIARFSRTQRYTIDDFDIWREFLEKFFGSIATNPNILTEVSNLVTKLPEKERPAFYDQMRHSIGVIDEKYCTSRLAVEDRNYRRLGLTDATILSVSRDLLVLTDDVALYHVLSSRGHAVINFTHIRAVMTLQ